MKRRRSDFFRSLFPMACLFCLPFALFSQTSELAFPYVLSIEPEKPLLGSTLIITIEIEGLSGVSLGGLELETGLDFVAASGKPKFLASGDRGSELTVELVVRRKGSLLVSALDVFGNEGKLAIGPFRIETAQDETQAGTGIQAGVKDEGQNAPKPESRADSSASGGTYRWRIPERVYRFQAFVASLEPLVAGSGAIAFQDSEALVSLAPAEGLLIEPLPAKGSGTSARFIVTAFESGSLSLPAAAIGDGDYSSSATFEALEPPASLFKSRAFGTFSLAFVKPERISSESPVLIGLALSGTGNFPSLRMPSLSVFWNEKPLPPATLSLKFQENFKAGGDGYEGSLLIEVTVPPQAPGRLRVEAEGFAFLTDSGEIRESRIKPLVLELPSLPKDRSSSRSGVASSSTTNLLEGLYLRAHEIVSASDGAIPKAEAITKAGGKHKADTAAKTGAIPKTGAAADATAVALASAAAVKAELAGIFASAGLGSRSSLFLGPSASLVGGLGAGRARELLDSLPLGSFAKDESALLDAAIVGLGGDEGRAVALVYAMARRGRGGNEIRRLARSISAALSAGEPRVEVLPPSRALFAVAILSVSIGLGLLFMDRTRKRLAAKQASIMPNRPFIPAPSVPLTTPLRPPSAPPMARFRPSGTQERAVFTVMAVFIGLFFGFSALGMVAEVGTRVECAIAWSEKALAVPSEKAESYFNVKKGSVGTLIGRAPGYSGIRFADGAVGWLAADSVYYY